MKNIYILLCFFTSLIIYCCSNMKGDNQFIDSQFINKLANEKFEGIPSIYSFYFLFVKCDNDSIVLTSLDRLHNCYTKRYKQEMTFSNFLTKSLNQQLIIRSNQIYYSEKFVLNDTIKQMYEEGGFDFIKSKFYITNEKRMVSKLSESYENSIMYYFFLNNYLVMIDDISCYCIMIPYKDVPVGKGKAPADMPIDG